MRFNLGLDLGLAAASALPPIITPASASLSSFQTQAFSVASGGTAPFAYSITAGASTGAYVNPSTGVLYAGPKAGSVTVRVTDALGKTSDAPVTVSALSKQKAWWRASLGATDAGAGACSAWADQNGVANNFTASGAARPTITASALGTNARTVLRGNGTTNKMVTTSTLAVVATAASGSVVVVGNYTGGVAAQTNKYDDPTMIGDSVGYWEFTAAATRMSGTISDGAQKNVSKLFTAAPFYAIYSWDSTSASLRVNGVAATDTTPVGAITLTAQPINLFAGYNTGPGTVFFGGDIGDVLTFNAKLSAGEITNLEAALAAYYGI